jgi:hypothetical protein
MLSLAKDSDLSVAAITRAVLLRPDLYLLARWNWKSAFLSAVVRSALFFAATLRAGHSAALSASAIEFALALTLAGFVGALAQAYRRAHPRWLAFLMAASLPPAIWHAFELTAHLLNGTPRIYYGVGISMVYSALTSALTLSLMRRGIWLAGEERTSLREDLGKIVAMLRGHSCDP